MTPEELGQVASDNGLPAYTARQLSRWLYVKKVRSIEEMSDISKSGRENISKRYTLGLVPSIRKIVSSDGTAKYLFPISAENAGYGASEKGSVETVVIPEDDRATLCVSSQVGCRMGCRFCMTGRQGFHGQLSSAEIINQFISVDESDRLTNAVFMGMGEPLDNYDDVMKAISILTSDWGFGWSPKRITVSTVGVLPALKRFLDESRCHIAVSLHNPFPDERLSIIPVQKAYPLADVVDLLKRYDFSGQRRISFEYTMFSGFNDTKRHADALARLLYGLECRVNLIKFHQIPDFPYKASPLSVMKLFQERLERAKVVTTIRTSRGEDIMAACGLLSGKHLNGE